MPSSAAPGGEASSPSSYTERLTVPLWWWPVAAFLVTLLGAEFHVGLPLAAKVATYLVFGGVAVFLLLFAGAVRVGVRDGALLAGRASLPVRHAGEVHLLDRAAIRRLMGPEADPAAWTVHRPWIREGLAVVVADPDDDTPYWLISTRRPTRLAAALAAAQSQVLPGAPAPPDGGA